MSTSYGIATCLQTLENSPLISDGNVKDCRLPYVQDKTRKTLASVPCPSMLQTGMGHARSYLWNARYEAERGSQLALDLL